MRGIYAYHVNGSGWCDIGYQFLVDRFGRIFEGRSGGDAPAVIGAQAGGFNSQTFGVSSWATTTRAARVRWLRRRPSWPRSAKLIGWKGWLNGWDPTTASTSFTSAGSTRWPAGTVITEPRVRAPRLQPHRVPG